MKILFSDVTFSYLTPGGKQVHAAQLMKQLLAKGVDTAYETWHDPGLKPSLVHFFGFNDIERLRLLKRRGVGLVYTHIMDGITNQPPWRRRYHAVKSRMVSRFPRRLEQLTPWRGLELFDALVYMHEADRETAIAVYGVDPARTTVIPHGVEDVGAFQHRQAEGGDRYLISLGSIVPRKNPLFTAAACGDAGVPVVFVGHAMDAASDYHRRFMDAAHRAGATVHTDVTPDMKLRLLANASGFILLSHGESGCLSVYEAAATGLPLLLADLPWAKGYDQPTFLEHCSTTMHHAAVAKIRDFYARAHRLSQPTLRVRTWPEIADMYLDTYRRVLARGRA